MNEVQGYRADHTGRRVDIKRHKRIPFPVHSHDEVRKGHDTASHRRHTKHCHQVNIEASGPKVRLVETEENMKLVYWACFYTDSEDGSIAVVVPDLPGCTTGGNDLAEAIEMAIDAASGWVLTEPEDGMDIPPSTPIDEVELDPDMGKGFVAPIVLDMDSYTEKHGKKSIRKNLTVPNWLNTRAELAHINFSQVLQDALIERLGLSDRKGA